MEGAAGGGGFRTREPQGRMGKQGRGGREAIEKQRLAQRVEGFERYEDPGKLTEFEHSAAGHAPEAERFDKDFAVVEQHTREKDRQRHGAIIGARRQERLDREEERWQVTEQSRVYVLWASSLAPASPHLLAAPRTRSLSLPRLSFRSSKRSPPLLCLRAGWRWSGNGSSRRRTRRRPTRAACRTTLSR